MAAKLIEATKIYNKEMCKIIEERDAILPELESLNQRTSIIESKADMKLALVPFHESSSEQIACLEQHNNRSRLFADRQSVFAKRESTEYQEMSEQLQRLMRSYPRLDSQRRNDSSYVNSAHDRLIEHHLLVLESKKYFLEIVHKMLDRHEQHLNLIQPATPGFGQENN